MPLCEACGQEGATKCCSRCNAARYCGFACQKRHWNEGHKHKCVEAHKLGAATAAAGAATPRPAAAGGVTQGSGVDSGGGVGAGHDEECAICLEGLQQPQTMPCGHRFCRGCVASMRRHGAAVAQVCPLCRGAMPDAERLQSEARRLLTQHERWKRCHDGDAPVPAAVKALVGKAAALCRAALAIDPADAHAQHLLGNALGEGEDSAGAEAACRAAIAAYPQDAGAHCNLGGVLLKRGDKAGAEAAIRAGVAADPQNAAAHSNLGNLLLERGDKAGAEAVFRTAITADPQHAKGHYNLGCLLGQRGDAAGAARSFAAALKIDPCFADAKANLQIALRMLKEERRIASLAYHRKV